MVTQNSRINLAKNYCKKDNYRKNRRVKISCQSCNQNLDIPEDLVGKEIECPTCKTRLIVQAPTTSALPPIQTTDSQPHAASTPPPITSPNLQNPQAELDWIDKTFKNNAIIVLIIFSVCCNGIAVILGIIGVILCKDPVAKKNAIIVLIISGCSTILFMAYQILAIISS